MAKVSRSSIKKTIEWFENSKDDPNERQIGKDYVLELFRTNDVTRFDIFELIKLVVTPDIAKNIIKATVPNQRNISPKHLADYINNILDNNWHRSLAFLQFDNEGNLNDGHQRLLAIINSDTPVYMFLGKGISPEATAYAVDTGKSRTKTDRMNFHIRPSVNYSELDVKLAGMLYLFMEAYKKKFPFNCNGRLSNIPFGSHEEFLKHNDLKISSGKEYAKPFAWILPQYIIGFFSCVIMHESAELTNAFFNDLLETLKLYPKAPTPEFPDPDLDLEIPINDMARQLISFYRRRKHKGDYATIMNLFFFAWDAYKKYILNGEKVVGAIPSSPRGFVFPTIDPDIWYK